MTIIPSCEQINLLAANYSIIPVSKEIYADVITPITLLRRISQHSKKYFLLESIEGGETWGRYSFLGFQPIMRVTCKNKTVTVTDSQASDKEIKTREIKTSQPYEVLRSIMEDYKAPRIDGLPPFAGGLVGYFAYSMIGYAEPKLHISQGDANDFDLMLFDKVIAYDHLKQKISIVVNMKTDHVMENYGNACADIEAITAMILDSSPLPKSKVFEKPQFACNVSKEEYCSMVEKAKEYIVDGDIFQAVLSRRFTCHYEESLLNAYRVLRTTNPSPYMVYLHMNEEEIISTSPETLVRLQNGRLTTFPVAGSRPRGNTQEEDSRLERELMHDEKELAEHNMLWIWEETI